MPFSTGDLNISEFVICGGSWNQFPWIQRTGKYAERHIYTRLDQVDFKECSLQLDLIVVKAVI